MSAPQEQGRVGKNSPPLHSRFKPGQSGNPGGKPKGTVSVTAALLRLLEQRATGRAKRRSPNDPKLKADLVAEQLFKLAIKKSKGDTVAAIKVILDRIDGPVKTEITGAEGGALFFVGLPPVSPATVPEGEDPAGA